MDHIINTYIFNEIFNTIYNITPAIKINYHLMFNGVIKINPKFNFKIIQLKIIKLNGDWLEKKYSPSHTCTMGCIYISSLLCDSSPSFIRFVCHTLGLLDLGFKDTDWTFFGNLVMQHCLHMASMIQ